MLLRILISVALLSAGVTVTVILVRGIERSSAQSMDELAQKREWSVLQSYEYRYRATRAERGPLVVPRANGAEYTVIGIPLEGPAGYAWLVANPSSLPRVKVMPPDARFKLSAAQLEEITTATNVDREVLKFLEQHVVR